MHTLEEVHAEGMATCLRPTTLSKTIGIRPLHVLRSKVSLSGNMRIASQTRKRKAAMRSCINKKNNGTAVEFNTHLLLRRFRFTIQTKDVKCSYATTIYEKVS